MNSFNFLICEGPHDVAFIEKILLSLNFKKEGSLKIQDFPPPLDSLFKQQAEKIEIQSLNFIEVGNSLLPASTLKKDSVYFFLYSMSGDTKADRRLALINKVLDIPSEEEEIGASHEDCRANIIYIFDADDKGIAKRKDEINRELRSIDILDNNLDISTGAVKNLGVVFDAFIFTNEHGENGKLEDLLIPLMKRGNENIFEGAQKFITKYYEESRTKVLRQTKCSETGEITENRRKKTGFCEKKALIGISGQLQCSGATNTVHISRSDYLKFEDLDSSTSISNMVDFFKQYI